MKITENGVLLTNQRTGAVIAVEGGKVYDCATGIALNHTSVSSGVFKYLKNRKSYLSMKDALCDNEKAELDAIQRAMGN